MYFVLLKVWFRTILLYLITFVPRKDFLVTYLKLRIIQSHIKLPLGNPLTQHGSKKSEAWEYLFIRINSRFNPYPPSTNIFMSLSFDLECVFLRYLPLWAFIYVEAARTLGNYGIMKRN